MDSLKKKSIIFLVVALSYWIITLLIKLSSYFALLFLSLVSIIASALAFSGGIKLVRRKDYHLGFFLMILGAILVMVGVISLILEVLIRFL